MAIQVSLPTDDPVLADFLESIGLVDQANRLRGFAPTMYLWLLSQDENDGYDTFDSCIVAAVDEYEARRIHPGWGSPTFNEESERWEDCAGFEVSNTWASHPDRVTAQCIGAAGDGVKPGLVLGSFHAG